MADDGEKLIPTPPRKEDVLFCDGFPDWWNNACLSSVGAGDGHGYTEGYRRGARLLVKHTIENRTDQDYLVYPIIFLYRHHIELSLKSLMLATPYVVDRSLSKAEKSHLNKHRLDLLWNYLKPMLPVMSDAAGWPRLSAADIEGIDSHIRQLTALDSDSYSFRYTHTKKGKLSLPPDLIRINLRHFAATVERLADYLRALGAAVGVLEEGKMEMEAERRSQG